MDSSNVIAIVAGLRDQSYVLSGSNVAPGVYCRHIRTNHVSLLEGDALVEVINGLLAPPASAAAGPTRVEAGYIWYCAEAIQHVTPGERTRILCARHPQIVDIALAQMSTVLVGPSRYSNSSFPERVLQTRYVDDWSWGLFDDDIARITWYTFPQEPGFCA